MKKLTVLMLLVSAVSLGAAPKPNVLFCMADDWGWPHASAYGDPCVKTPSFDRLAQEGVLLHHVYVSSPSCTPSRNAVITGKYHWELGPGGNLWSTLPAEHESYIHLLEDAGYVIGRDRPKTWGPGKIDSWANVHGNHPAGTAYNGIADFFAKTDAEEMPFFFWLATSDPHRGYVKDSGRKSGIDPATVHLFGHYPKSDVVRNDVADYYFEVQRWDTKVGNAVELLEQKGLLENTIVIMTGDHGMPFPRCKGNLYDSGVRVPFAVRWGKGIKAGRELQDFISFADVAPTLLEATGTPVPEVMTGRSFLSLLKSKKSGVLDAKGRPDIVFGRERHVPSQEKPNMAGYPSRGLRDRSFLYIRNYAPDRWPMGSGRIGFTNYPGQWYADCDGGPTKDYIVANKDKDEEHRRAFDLCFAKRPAEELYDLKRDPEQLENVATDPEYAQVLKKMRSTLKDRLADRNDPRAKDPNYTGFDGHPYLGGGGGKKNAKKKGKK